MDPITLALAFTVTIIALGLVGGFVLWFAVGHSAKHAARAQTQCMALTVRAFTMLEAANRRAWAAETAKEVGSGPEAANAAWLAGNAARDDIPSGLSYATPGNAFFDEGFHFDDERELAKHGA